MPATAVQPEEEQRADTGAEEEGSSEIPSVAADSAVPTGREVVKTEEDPEDTAGTSNQSEDEDMPQIYECPVCGSEFDRIQAGHGHIRFAHPDLSDEEFEEVYEEMKEESFFVEEPGEEEAEGREAIPVPSKPEQRGASAREPFEWGPRLETMTELREKLEQLDRSREPSALESLFGKSGERDEGIQECLDALDVMEMDVRERLGMSTEDRRLQQQVDRTLDRIDELVRAREQREALEDRFSDRPGTPDRIGRLNEKEVEVRKHVRSSWGAGKPAEELDSEDPVSPESSEG